MRNSAAFAHCLKSKFMRFYHHKKHSRIQIPVFQPMQKYRAPAFLLALLPLVVEQAHAADESPQPGATVIEAQRLEIFLDRKLRAIGEAEIRKDDKTISGDRIHYDMLNEELHVIGNTRIEQNGSVILGPELRLKLEEREGEMKEPIFTFHKQPPVAPGEAATTAVSGAAGFSRGDAKLLVFEGPEKERLHSARYTTCAAGVDDWYLRASELEIDHYTETATATHASIEFKGIPILYTPWIDFPFRKQRKSGFLAPNFGTTSRSGAEFALPYYWNIAPDMDATITPRYLGKRGLQMQGEFRYLDEDYVGQDNIEFLPSDQQTDHDRYFARLKHNHNFGSGWSGGFNVERVSDDQYFSDMSTSILATSRVNLPQEASLAYNDDIWHFAGLAQQYQTLDGVSFPYQRLPQLTLTGNKDWDMATGSLYTQWVRFDRSDLAPATVTGNRFTAYPSISLPLVRPFGYITPRLGLHYTKYDLGGNTLIPGTTDHFQSDSRSLPIFSVDSGLYFDRDFRVVRNTYTQTLEPRLFYVYIPFRDQSRLPVFDSGEADLNLSTLFAENQFTGNDRINNANQVSLAVTSRLIDARSGIQRLAATIGQRFYFSDQKVTLPGGVARTSNTSDIVAAVTARLLNHWNIDAAWQYNTDRDRSIKSNIGARYNPEPGKALNLSYRFTRDRLEQIDVSSEWPLGDRWYGLARWNYSLRENRPIEGLAGAEYDAGCWQARAVVQRVSTATANANYALFFQLELGGLASIGTSPLTLLKRSIPGYTSTALIPYELRQP